MKKVSKKTTAKKPTIEPRPTISAVCARLTLMEKRHKALELRVTDHFTRFAGFNSDHNGKSKELEISVKNQSIHFDGKLDRLSKESESRSLQLEELRQMWYGEGTQMSRTIAGLTNELRQQEQMRDQLRDEIRAMIGPNPNAEKVAEIRRQLEGMLESLKS